MNDTRIPNVTVLTPVRNESRALEEYRQRVTASLFAATDTSFRVLFIDDGSADDSWEMIKGFCAADERFAGIRLSRNFGVHAALAAGLQQATGDAVAVLACDLQDPPETILEFVAKWKAGAKIVFGKRRQRADPGWRIATSNWFEGLLRRFAMPRGSKFTTGSFLLADRQVVECYCQFPEHNRITFALIAWTGFNQDVVEYDRVARQRGKSAWTLGSMIKAFYDAFIGFSYLPIRMISVVGVAVFALSMALSLYSIFCWLTGKPIAGWTSTMVVLGIFFGMQFFLMSLIGEYLYRLYSEAVRRPLYFISEEIKEGGNAGAGR